MSLCHLERFPHVFSYGQVSFQCAPYGEVGLTQKNGRHPHKDEVQEEIESTSQCNCLTSFPKICIVRLSPSVLKDQKVIINMLI